MMRLQDASSLPSVVAIGQSAEAGPWRLTVQQVQLGDEAAATLLGTNAGNPDAPEGLVYALAYLSAENTSGDTQVINMSDFAAAGPDGILRRPPALIPPSPALQGPIEAGAMAEGWIPLAVNDTSNVVLWFASPFLGGTWSETTLALTDGATVPAFDPPADDPQRGLSPDAPAGFNESVRAGGWDVTLLEHISGEAVFNIAEFALQALAGGNPADPEVSTWHAIRVRATNVSNRPAFFSFTALRLAAGDGEPWDHLLALTPPIPDVAREVLPGATREGWAAFQLQSWASLDLVRIQPSRVADEPRFVSFTGGSATTPQPPSEPPQLNAGDGATIAEDRVNLRTEASASGTIVVELTRGTAVTVTGASVDADGYVWYPVSTADGTQSGYVVADFLMPASGA